MLTSLPLFSEVDAINFEWGNERRVEFLSKSLSRSKYSTNKLTYLSWLKVLR